MSQGLMEYQESANEAGMPLELPWAIWEKHGSDTQKKEDWFKITLETLQKISEERILNFANNLLWYTGEYEKTLEYRIKLPNQAEETVPRRTIPRIFNHISDITEQRVSIMSRFRPSFDVVPTNREENDRRVTKLLKISLDAIDRRTQMDLLIQNLERWTAVWGEALLGIEWNKNIGDRRSRGSIERVGDVDVFLKEPWTYFPFPCRDYAQMQACIDIEDIIHVDEARKRFDAPSLEPDKDSKVFTFDSNVLEKRPEELVVYRLIQLPSPFCPNGIVAFFVGGKLLEEETKNYPYSHNDFPWERHTDIDVPGRFFPMSAYQHIRPVQHAYNRLTSSMIRNILLTGHPHILIPQGSRVKREAMGNAPTAVTYAGQKEPKIVTFPSVPNEMFEMRKELKAEMGEIYGVQNTLRGNPPPGTRATSMLRWFEEQQEVRMGTQIAKHNELIRRSHWKMASVVGDYYPTKEKGSKERLVRVLGRENQYIIESFNDAKISSEYDIVILNSTGFSRTMSGRLEEISAISQMEQQSGQAIMSPQQKAEVLETKDPGRAYDILTNSLKTAEMYCEWFLMKKPVPSPKPYWDLITHWRTLMLFMNAPEWPSYGADIVKAVEEHLIVLEDQMQRKKALPSFAMKLDMLEGFPAAFNMAAIPETKPKQPAPAGPVMPPPGIPAAPPILPGVAGPEPTMPGNGL